MLFSPRKAIIALVAALLVSCVLAASLDIDVQGSLEPSHEEVMAADQAELDLIKLAESPAFTESQVDMDAYAVEAMKHAVDATAGGYVASEAKLDILYAAAAYCALAAPEKLKTWTCNSCSLAPRLTDVSAFNKVTARGMVGYDARKKRIVVGFSGTPFKSISTWLANVDAAHTSIDKICKGCKAHRGFYAGYTSIRGPIMDAVKALQKKYNNPPIVATGHSLGGAQATFFMAEAAANKWKLSPRFYTYGAPRPGNPAFAKHLGNINSKLFRLVNKRDKVPHVPLPAMPGAGNRIKLFAHPPTEVYFDDVTSDVPYICAKDKTGENPECPSKMWKKVKEDIINAHLYYASFDLHKHGCGMPGGAWDNFKKDIKTITKPLVDKGKQVLDKAKAKIKTTTQKLVDKAKAVGQKAKATTKKVANKIKTTVKKTTAATKAAVKKTTAATKAAVKKTTAATKAAVKKTTAATKSAVKKTTAATKSAVKKTTAATKATVKKTATATKAAVKKTATATKALVSKLKSKVIKPKYTPEQIQGCKMECKRGDNKCAKACETFISTSILAKIAKQTQKKF